MLLLNLDCILISAVYIICDSVEAESEELTQDHDHFDMNKKNSAQEELGAVVEGEAAISPEEAPVEEDNPVIVTPQEDRVADDTNRAASQDSDIKEPLASDPQEATEVETFTVEAAEASPDETPEETVESVSAENQAQISDIPLEASDDKSEHKNVEKAVVPEETLIDPAGNTEIEESLNLTPDKPLVLAPKEDETEEASQEEPASQESVVELTDQVLDREDEEESDPILLSNTEKEDTNEVVVESVDVVEATGVASVEQQSPPSTLEQDETDVLFSLELEVQVEPAEEEMAAKELATEYPAVIAVLDNSEEEPALEEQVQGEPVLSVPPVTSDPEASEEHTEDTEENTTPNLPNNGEYVPSTIEEDETVVLIFDMDEESQEDPAVVVINSSEEELELEEQVQVETIPSVSPEISDNSEERTEIETEENTAQNSPDNGKHFPGASEENTTVVRDSKEEAAAETTTEEPPIIIVEPINEEPAAEEPLLIILAEGEEDSQGDSSKGAVQSDLHPEEAVLGERTALLSEAGDSGADKLVTSGTETTEEVLEPGEVHVGTLDPVTFPVPSVTDAETESKTK